MEDSKLERKLREIQDLKREKYIGTQQAWIYLKRLDSLYDNPVKIASAINDVLEQSGEKVLYRATPERIVGLGNAFVRLCQRVFLNVDENEIMESEDEKAEIVNGRLYLRNPLFRFAAIISEAHEIDDIFEDHEDECSIEYMISYLSSKFLAAQIPGINDCTFGPAITINAFEDFPLLELEREYLMKTIPGVNWEYGLSKDNLRKVEREIKEGIFSDEISLSGRLDKMERDQVEHRLWNRREIASDLVKQIGSVDKAISDYEERIRKRQIGLKTLQEHNAPKIIIESEKRLLRRNRTYYHFIKSDEPYLRRLMEN